MNGFDGAPTLWVQGSAFYEARTPTPTGVSREAQRRPIRFARISFQGESGDELADGSLDEVGRFIARVPVGVSRVRVWAETDRRGTSLAVTRDPAGEEPYYVEAPIVAGSADIVADDRGSVGSAGAFHILDTLVRGVDAVHAWTGEPLPPVYAYWGRGVTTGWSYYRGERPVGSGRFCLELLGGELAQRWASDTDEHDTSIVLHEFAHFVMDRLSTDSSPGGMHPSGHLLEPGLAWEEGRASWFSAAVLQNPWYLDTVGLEPRGRLRVAHNLERGRSGPRGLGSEQGVAEILWDLADGAGALGDDDADGVAVGAAELFEAMTELRSDEGEYPALSTFLAHLVASGRVTLAELRSVLAAGGHPASLMPETRDPWPPLLPVPGAIGAKIDGLSDPAPSGGPNRPSNGFDAVHVYKVRLERSGTLAAELRIQGSGRHADRQDLDLELRDIRANLLASARGETRVERVSRRLRPGWYVLYVRDGGGGNRVGYRLRVWTNP